MSNISTGINAAYAARQFAKQAEVLAFAKTHPTEAAQNAQKSYKRGILLTIIDCIILVAMFIVGGLLIATHDIQQPTPPVGTVETVVGHPLKYSDEIVYKIDEDYFHISPGDTGYEDYKKKSSINIYLDEYQNVIGTSEYQTDLTFYISMVIIFLLCPMIAFIAWAFISRATIMKPWMQYFKWYQKEIFPYKAEDDFETTIANKQFYIVETKLSDMSPDNLKAYKKKRWLYVVFVVALIAIIAIAFFAANLFNTSMYHPAILMPTIILMLVWFWQLEAFETKLKKLRYSDSQDTELSDEYQPEDMTMEEAAEAYRMEQEEILQEAQEDTEFKKLLSRYSRAKLVRNIMFLATLLTITIVSIGIDSEPLTFLTVLVGIGAFITAIISCFVCGSLKRKVNKERAGTL